MSLLFYRMYRLEEFLNNKISILSLFKPKSVRDFLGNYRGIKLEGSGLLGAGTQVLMNSKGIILGDLYGAVGGLGVDAGYNMMYVHYYPWDKAKHNWDISLKKCQ